MKNPIFCCLTSLLFFVVMNEIVCESINAISSGQSDELVYLIDKY